MTIALRNLLWKRQGLSVFPQPKNYVHLPSLSSDLIILPAYAKMHRSMTRCTTCRVSILDAFTSLAGVSIPAAVRRQLLVQPQVQPVRHFSQLRILRQSSSPPVSETSDTLQSPPAAEQVEPQTSIPWYLQIEEPAPPSTNFSPLLSRQEIPPLPENPPVILAPVLEYLSTQVGLDDLVLLDLRHLDPPPALGSNLIMIIGTARSVKHLNVSADRLCRWVRREYQLRPFADGLLGRNELKLKLRRKARRLKLAQSVGNTTVENESVDDGITTGWICVNMGQVDVDLSSGQHGVNTPAVVVDQAEGEEEEYHNPPEEDTYVGFGSQSKAPRIVVQMFTDEKRADMDLEGLWAGRNTRRERQAQRADAAFERNVVEDNVEFESTSFEEKQSEQRVGRKEVESSWNASRTLADRGGWRPFDNTGNR
ncbi:uncharacterized protein A1O9_10886 [Exophiala aquamarina CBS 119918]|uniref:ATPase synthesis protein 25 n=1 Tax=Exophiala aquamarina CBS 119918 TaxID=1182545 RepID=A0A072NYN3_9EURO|nr:uncharacterized protein A1O9_10886 [Exophiala aquamarina CBS 119918]KEF52979.1 hypothetical protein A1O9_10886 [Exophiala aquamarina CBS 119918]